MTEIISEISVWQKIFADLCINSCEKNRTMKMLPFWSIRPLKSKIRNEIVVNYLIRFHQRGHILAENNRQKNADDRKKNIYSTSG